MKKIYDTKANYVFDYIKERIIKGVYKQGESIVISRIAKELGLSAIPVRESLQRLQSEGLVEIIPHKGARVTSFDQNKINDVLVIRAVLEGYTAGVVTNTISEATLNRLYQMNEKMGKLAEEDKDEEFSDLNKEFHRLLYKNSPNLLLYNTIFDLWDGENWSKSLFAFYPEKMKESVREHQEILDAIKEQNADKVEKLTREHKMKNIKLYYGILNKSYL